MLNILSESGIPSSLDKVLCTVNIVATEGFQKVITKLKVIFLWKKSLKHRSDGDRKARVTTETQVLRNEQ